MGSFEATERGLRDEPAGGPTTLRILVGLELRRHREAAGLSRETAGYEIRASASKMSRLEAGRTGFKPRDLADLLTLYGVSEADRTTVLTMAEAAGRPAWWQAYAEVVPAWFEPYLGLEQDASLIRGFEMLYVPGLLQTEDYARAVVGLIPEQPVETAELRVALRMRRQEIISRTHPPHLWVVMDEAVLRRAYGGAAVMRGQLRHLIEISGLSNVTIQVIPFHVGGHAAAGGPIALLRSPQPPVPDVIYLEQLSGAIYRDRAIDRDHYWHVLNRLVTEAASPSASRTLLRDILRET